MNSQTTTKLAIPNYLALDADGAEYIRRALTVGELRHPECMSALKQATQGVGTDVGLTPVKDISFGLPVYTAFGLTLAEAKSHSHSMLLLAKGEDIPLIFCASYN
jgi:hypothetical protein